MRFVNLLVIAALIIAASVVYKIKFDSTLQAEKVNTLRSELRHERNAIATLRAEWAKLDTPSRIQTLAERFLPNLQPAKATQFSNFHNLPARPPDLPPTVSSDALSVMRAPSNSDVTGSLPVRR